jgi:uncharacterized membrane protein (UPF0127 family)
MTRRLDMTRSYWVAGALSLAMLSSARADGALQHLEVDTASGPHTFKIELMRSEAEREKGLMFRRSMADDHGMLFDFPQDEPLVFWMKNTYIPLDMVFVARDGHVVSITRDAKPMDETLISSGVPAAGVLEINAGLADKIGLKIGDEIKHPMFHAAAK